MTLKFKTLIDYIERLYPPQLAESWDKVGLHFGEMDSPVYKVMTLLDVRHEAVDYAIEKGVDTLLVHHPLLFHPIERFDWANRQTSLYRKLIQHNIKVYAMHTNVDAAHGGMNDWLAQALGLEDIQPLEMTEQGPGIGRIGRLPQPLSRVDLLNLLKKSYSRTQLPVVEKDPKDWYETIALVGGAGIGYLSLARQAGADVFLTGDISYHAAQGAEDEPLMTVDVGHYTESIFGEKLAEVLNEAKLKEEWPIEIEACPLNLNPFTYE